MKRVLIIFCLLGLCLSLGACGAKKAAEKAANEQDKLFKAQRQALEKAKEVQATVMKAAAERRKEIDEQSR